MITKIFADRIRKEFFRLAILSLVIVVIWLVMTTYRALNKSQTPPDVKKQLLPLTTTLPLDTMEDVAGRLESPPIDWSSLNLTAPMVLVEKPTEVTINQIETSTASASVSGGINEVETSTESASVSGGIN